VLAAAFRLIVQFSVCEPLSTIHDTTPADEPDTLPESGLVAENVIVPG
jgi:hypothetical protein